MALKEWAWDKNAFQSFELFLEALSDYEDNMVIIDRIMLEKAVNAIKTYKNEYGVSLCFCNQVEEGYHVRLKGTREALEKLDREVVRKL